MRWAAKAEGEMRDGSGGVRVSNLAKKGPRGDLEQGETFRVGRLMVGLIEGGDDLGDEDLSGVICAGTVSSSFSSSWWL